MAKSNRSGVWQRTMVIVGFVLVLGFGAVITNLVRLQLVNGETLKTDAVDQSLQSTQLTPSRGTIYDATGTKVLAQSASVWTVALEPNYIDEGDDVKIAKGLSEILGLDYDDVLKKAQQNSYFVYVKRKVETEVRDENRAVYQGRKDRPRHHADGRLQALLSLRHHGFYGARLHGHG